MYKNKRMVGYYWQTIKEMKARENKGISAYRTADIKQLHHISRAYAICFENRSLVDDFNIRFKGVIL